MKRSLLILNISFIFSLGIKGQCLFPNSYGSEPCIGACCAEAYVLADSGDHYLWSTGDTTNTVHNLCAGNYACSVMDSTGNFLCTCALSISQPTHSSFNVFDSLVNAPCSAGGGHIFLSPDMSGYGVNPDSVEFILGTDDIHLPLYSPFTAIDTSPTASGLLPPGNYNITAVNLNCPSDSQLFSYFIDTALWFTPFTVEDSVQPAYCYENTGFIFLTVFNGDGNYIYNNPGLIDSPGTNPNILYGNANGYYTISVAEANCPWLVDNITVFIPDTFITLNMTVDVASASTCNSCDGSIILSVSGGSGSYWFGNSVYDGLYGYSSNFYWPVMCAGTSTIVHAEDAQSGCVTNNDTIFIQSLSDSINLTAINTGIACTHGTDTTIVTVTGGIPFFSYNWGDGANDYNISSSAMHIYLQGSTYLIQVSDSAGCSFLLQNTVPDSGILLSFSTPVIPSCTNPNSGKIKVSPNNGQAPYTYVWNTGATTDSLTNLEGGDYSITVTDNTGCTALGTFHLGETTFETGYYVFLNPLPDNCAPNGSDIAATVYGGTPPFVYNWNTAPVQTTDTALGLSPGYYAVSVTDSLGCKTTGQIYISSGCYNVVYGTIFADSNGNCIMDSNEAPVANITVAAVNGNEEYFSTTDNNGYYAILVTDSGIYNIVPGQASSSCYTYNLCSDTQVVHFAGFGDSSANHNFGILNAHSFDLTLHPGWTSINPGFQKEYWVMPYNAVPYTYTGQPATVTFTFDSNLIYQYSLAPLPTVNLATHTLTWIVPADSIPYPSFNWSNERFVSYFLVPSTLSPDYLLQSAFTILPDSGDCNPSNNFLNFSQTCGGSHDPNEKDVIPSGQIGVADSVFTYTIYFQNTGTAQTDFIIVKDTLSPSLNPATVVNLASSHQYSDFTITGTDILTWAFNPLQLPDSISSSMGSKGFIIFSVKKRNGIPSGTSINNAAPVYFDYNNAVVTNTVTDSVVTCTVSRVTLRDSVCAGDTVYLGGQAYFSAGTHIDTLTGSAGCDSIITLQLTIKPVPAMPTITAQGHALQTSSGLNYQWYLNDTLIAGDTSARIFVTQNGNYQVQITGANGCSSISAIYEDSVADLPVAGFVCDSAYNALNGLPPNLFDCNTGSIVSTDRGFKFLNKSSNNDSVVWHVTPLECFFVNYTCDSFITCNDTAIESDTLLITTGELYQNGLCAQGGWINNIIVCLTAFNQHGSATLCDTTCQIHYDVAINDIPAPVINIYPNPTSDLIYIKTEGIQPQTTSIYDVNGQLISTMRFVPQLDVSRLVPGVYLIEVSAPEGVARRRFVKM